jgi:hypothetical protein
LGDVPKRGAKAAFDPGIHRPLLDLVREGFPDISPADANTLREVLQAYRERLARLNVLTGLDERQQTELAAIVSDLSDRYQMWHASREHDKSLKRLSRRGPGHIKNLHLQRTKILEAIEMFARRASLVDRSIADQVIPLARLASRALTAIDLTGTRSVEDFTKDMPSWYERSGWKIGDPKRLAATQLVEYFKGSRRVRSARAVQLRTAVIGNAFWAWGFKIGRDPNGRLECPAVRMLVTRPTKTSF